MQPDGDLDARTCPELLPGLDHWLELFWELSTDRQIGMSVGPIPSASIDRAIQTSGIGEHESDLFRHCIRQADKAYLEIAALDEKERARRKAEFNQPMTPELFKRLFG